MLFRGEKLRELIKSKGLSPTQAADLLEVTPQYLSSIMSGKKKHLRESTVKKLCDTLKVHANYFYLEDSMLLDDVIPEASPEVKSFIMQQENLPYLVISEKAKSSGISPERLQQIIELIKDQNK